MIIDVQDQNRKLAEQINAEALSDSNSQYAGKFVGIVRGKVAVVAESLTELGDSLRQMAADREETFCIEAGRDYTEVHYI